MTAVSPGSKKATIAGLALALLVPALFTIPGGSSVTQDPDSVSAMALRELIMWALAFAVLGIVVFWEKMPLSSVGLGFPTWSAFALGARIAVGLLVLAALAGLLLQAVGAKLDDGQLDELLAIPIWLQILLVLRAGFVEELLFRGYAIERMSSLVGNRWLGAAIPVVVFGAIHAPFWGWPHALVAGLSGLWLTFIYLWRRNLWINIAAHTVLDAINFAGIDLSNLMGPGAS